MTGSIGIGIVGAGGIFSQHASAFAAHAGRARIVALCDVDEPRRNAAAARHGIPVTCGEHTALVARDDVDVVTVCTPPAFHEAVVLDALRAGKHVVCEKPLAPTLAAADRILAVAAEFPGRLSVVHQFRHRPEVRRAIWLRDTGRLGSLLFGRFHRFARFHRPGQADRPGWWGQWDVAGGGTVMTQLIHELDLMVHLFGAATQVVGVVDTLHESIESEDACAAVVRFAGGALVSCQSTMSAHRSSAGFDVVGTLGSAHSPWTFECLDRERRNEIRQAALAAVPDPPTGSTSDAHEPFMAAVLAALEAGRPLPSPGAEGRAALELATAIYASSLDGMPVALPLDRTHRYYAGITREDYDSRDGAGERATLAV